MKHEIKMLCEKCKSEQSINKKKSNENWKVYDCNVKCACGGTFKPDFCETVYKSKKV